MNHVVSKLKNWRHPDIKAGIIPLVALVMLTVIFVRVNSETPPSNDRQLGTSVKSGSDESMSKLPEVMPVLEEAAPDAGPLRISLKEIHQQNKDGFAKAKGFGRHRGGSHVLLGDGAVRFVEDSIRTNQGVPSTQSPHSSGEPSPYGLWGSLGTRAKHPTFDEIAKSSLDDLSLNHWKLEQIQLVSLDRFDMPIAYASADLPTIDQLEDSTIPTRELNEFETIAIAKIMRGQAIVTQRNGSTMQMVGAVNATQRKCVECHDVKADALLGAFSYSFKIEGRK